MSFTDPETTPVQPEGQGEGGGQPSGDQPYADYLNRIPEEAREHVEPVFADYSKDVNRKFQEHSDYRKAWEPYDQLGLRDQDPQMVEQALQLYQVASEDPATFQNWFNEYAQERGLTQAQAAEQLDTGLEEFGSFDERQQFDRLLEERLQPVQQLLEQYGQRFQQLDQNEELAAGEQFVNNQLSELEKKHGISLANGSKEREMVELFAQRYVDQNPEEAIPRGFQDWRDYVNGIEKQALQPKVDAPSPAEGGGVPDVSAEKFRRLQDPGLAEQAKEFMRNMNRG